MLDTNASDAGIWGILLQDEGGGTVIAYGSRPIKSSGIELLNMSYQQVRSMFTILLGLYYTIQTDHGY